ncbi:MAG: hypothetical protein H0W82_00320 [Actinobacteria bacterium]|nr:hypothetical protein [Actinomycetota bacterium]
MAILRAVGAVLGGCLFLATSYSVLRTLVIPGGRAGLALRTVDRAVDALFRTVSSQRHDAATHHRLLQAQAPMILVAMLGAWLIGYLVAFALLLWPQTGDVAGALRESGSSLLTLGFAATRAGTATTIDFLAGATGLVVVALQIAYLPTLYASFNRRETEVTLIGTRAGRPPWGPELLARSQMGSTLADLPEFYRTWERWAADVAESHASYPILVRFRSPNLRSSWLLALLAVMDSAALLHAISPGQTPLQARLSLRMGIDCLRELATTLGIAFEEDPRPDESIALTREEFDDGLVRLGEVGFPMERDADESWRHFAGWRVNYEPIAYRLAFAIDAVPAPWSGARRRAVPEVASRRFLNRTPDHPEGATGPFTRPPGP